MYSFALLRNCLCYIFVAMKMFDVKIAYTDVATAVMMVTANAAQQRGDAAHIATEDNDSLLKLMFAEVGCEVSALLSKYASSTITTDADFSFSLAENWDDALEDALKRRLKDVFVYGVLARWYTLSGDSVYGAMFQGGIDEIVKMVNKRVKPER